MEDKNIHNIPLPSSVRAIVRRTLLVGYDFLTPYLKSPTPFPDHREYVKSYSYDQEDLIIDAILGCKKIGRYIDIGANDPNLNNNTKRFYLRGWTGINVEPCTQRFADLERERPKDTNLNIAISDKDAEVPFYVLGWDMVSTLDKDVAIHLCKEYNTYIKDTTTTQTLRFDTLMEKYNGSLHVDFVSIDVETHEFAILKTNNWEKFRPTIFCIEMCYDNAEDMTAYMISKGYIPLFLTEENGFYIDGQFGGIQ